MDWDTFFQQWINAAVLGGTYCILAIGITLVFGLARMINFSHAAFGVFAGFIAFTMVGNGSSFWMALIVATLSTCVLAFLLQKALLERTLTNPMNGFIISLGFLLILQAFMVDGIFGWKLASLGNWGMDVHLIPAAFSGRWEVGGVIITHQRALNFGIAIGLTLLLLAVLQWTNFGRSVRATAEDIKGSQIVGVDTNAAISITFVFGTGLAAVAGVLLGTVIPFHAYSGHQLLIKAFAVTVIGGLGNIFGTIVAAFILATVETMGAAYWAPEWVPAYSLGFIIIVLLIKPAGLFKGVAAEDF